MIPNAGVVQSIDANLVNISGCWLWSTEAIYSQDYSEILVQPISVEANDISELRFLVAETILTIRSGTTTSSSFVWSGVVYTVDDPVDVGGGTGTTTGTVTSVGLSMPYPLFDVANTPITDSGSLVVTMTGDGTNVVLDDGTTMPVDSVGGYRPAYYNSLDQIELYNSVIETSFAPGATLILANTLDQGDVVKFIGNGQIKWNLINAIDSMLLQFKIGSTVITSTSLISNSLKPSILVNSLCNYVINIELNVNETFESDCECTVTGTIELFDGYTTSVHTINVATAIDTTIDNTVDLTATWAVAHTNNYITIDKLQILPILAIVNVITTEYINYNIDGGQANSNYGGSDPINAGGA